MTTIEKCERALVLAKELGLNDLQTKELMALVLELPFFKLNFQPLTVPATPIIPWQPQPNTPGWPNGIGTFPSPYPGDTIITYCVAPPRTDVVQLMNGVMSDSFFGLNTHGCACSPVGQPHHDNCKAG